MSSSRVAAVLAAAIAIMLEIVALLGLVWVAVWIFEGIVGLLA